MKNLFALTILRIINLQFKSDIGRNPNMVSLENSRGNSIYVKLTDKSVTISVYKVSRRCLILELTDESEIENAVVRIKEKIKCEDNLYE